MRGEAAPKQRRTAAVLPTDVKECVIREVSIDCLPARPDFELPVGEDVARDGESSSGTTALPLTALVTTSTASYSK